MRLRPLGRALAFFSLIAISILFVTQVVHPILVGAELGEDEDDVVIVAATPTPEPEPGSGDAFVPTVPDQAGEPDAGDSPEQPTPDELAPGEEPPFEEPVPVDEGGPIDKADEEPEQHHPEDVEPPPSGPRSVSIGDFAFWLLPAEPRYFPAVVDSNSPGAASGDDVVIFYSAWGNTFRSRGYPETQSVDGVTLPRPDRPGRVWIEAVWRDPDGRLRGWYHFEPEDLPCLTAPIIGAAVSDDDGLTWEDLGFVLQNGYPEDCEYNNGYFTGGNGDFSVIADRDGEYLYFLFSNYAGPIEQQGVAVARGLVSDRGAPGTVMKYFDGDWTQPGLGGQVTPFVGTPTGWAPTDMDAYWGPSVHWNSHLNTYVLLLNRAMGWLWDQEGVYVSLSSDLTHWSDPVRLMEAQHFYPQVVGDGPGETDSIAGKRLRLFVSGASFFELELLMPGEERSHYEPPPPPAEEPPLGEGSHDDTPPAPPSSEEPSHSEEPQPPVSEPPLVDQPESAPPVDEPPLPPAPQGDEPAPPIEEAPQAPAADDSPAP